VTNRGEEACECARQVGKRRGSCGSKTTESDKHPRQFVANHILAKTRQATNRNPIEADIAGELAADSETEPEELVQVDGELGWGQITCFKSLAF